MTPNVPSRKMYVLLAATLSLLASACASSEAYFSINLDYESREYLYAQIQVRPAGVFQLLDEWEFIPGIDIEGEVADGDGGVSVYASGDDVYDAVHFKVRFCEDATCTAPPVYEFLYDVQGAAFYRGKRTEYDVVLLNVDFEGYEQRAMDESISDPRITNMIDACAIRGCERTTHGSNFCNDNGEHFCRD